tara:strand:- start:24269 stop:25720 length:1452 start_codon:yes stop_codon:yes gene_type:complete
MSDTEKFENLINSISQKADYWINEKKSSANETTVGEMIPDFLKLLGFNQENVYSQYDCAVGEKIDYAVRIDSNNASTEFCLTPNEPDIIIKAKRTNVDFSDKSKKGYFNTVEQLQDYLRKVNCKSVTYGIIFNGIQVQVFRKHGKLSYPITSVLLLDKDNIRSTISFLKGELKHRDETRGSIITVWNNKGGVGKTTIAQSLGILLSEKEIYGSDTKNKVLIIDYDHNQGDLTENCGFEPSAGETKRLIEDDILGKLNKKNFQSNISKIVKEFSNNLAKRKPRFQFKIDILRSDSELNRLGIKYKEELITPKHPFPLRDLSLKFSEIYDYVIIDAPPNYEQSIFSKEAIIAADCILPIALYVNRNSIRNYANFVINDITEAQEKRGDGGPYSMGLWFNRWKSAWTDRQTKNCVKKQLNEADFYYHQAELKRIFYKTYLRQNLLRIIPECADIARSIMDSKGLPGVVRFIRARSALSSLLKEFID